MNPTFLNAANSTAAAPAITASAITASSSAAAVQQLAANSLPTTKLTPDNQDRLFLESCLNQLAPLFGDASIMQTLEYLPIEQIIELALVELVITMLEKASGNANKDLSILMSSIGYWKRTGEFKQIRELFLKNIEFYKLEKWKQTCENHLGVIEKLASRPTTFQTILKGPIDSKNRTLLFKFYVKCINAFSKHLLVYCHNMCLHNPVKIVGIVSRMINVSSHPAYVETDKIRRPPNLKMEVLRMLTKQLAFYSSGSRFSKLKSFLEKPWDMASTSTDEMNQYQLQVFQMCQGMTKVSSELRKQYVLLEKHVAARHMNYFSPATEEYLKKFFIDLLAIKGKFNKNLIRRFEEIIKLDSSIKSLVFSSYDSTIIYLCKIFAILQLERKIHLNRFLETLPDIVNKDECAAAIKEYSAEQAKEIEELQKLSPCNVVPLIKKFCDAFREELETFTKEVCARERQHFDADPLMFNSATKQFLSMTFHCRSMLNDLGNIFISLSNPTKVSIPQHGSKPFSTYLVALLSGIEEGEKRLGFNDFSKALSRVKDFSKSKLTYDENSKRLWELNDEGQTEIGRAMRDNILIMSGVETGMSLLRNRFSSVHSLMQQEAKEAMDQFNEQEKEWLQWIDDEQGNEIAVATTAAVESKKKDSSAKSKKKKAKKSAPNKSSPPTAAAASSESFTEQPFNVDRYSIETSRLIANHRHYLRRYYQVPDYIVTPISLTEKPFDSPEIALQQQILSTDCLQWVIGMMQKTKNMKVKQLLATYFFWWLHLATEQGLTSKALKKDSSNPLTHRVNKLCEMVGVKANRHLLKGHIWGTDYIRYPFTVPKPDGEQPLALRHVTEPSSSTTNEVMAATEPMMKEFVQLQGSIFESSKSATLTSQKDKKESGAASAHSSAANAAASQSVAPAASPKLQNQIDLLDEMKKKLTNVIESHNGASQKLMKAVLQNVHFHLDNLQTVLSLIMEQPEQENVFVQMTIAYLSIQNFCENLGHYVALQQGVDLRRHNLMGYATIFGLGEYNSAITDEIKRVNLGKGSEYLFRKQKGAEVMETVRYLSGSFVTSKYVTLTAEGIKLPKTNEMSVFKMHEEMEKKLASLSTLAVNLIATHF